MGSCECLSLSFSALPGYLWVETGRSEVDLRVDSPWISSCHAWPNERVDNRSLAEANRAIGYQH